MQFSTAQLELMQAIFDRFQHSGHWPKSELLNVEFRSKGNFWEIASGIDWRFLSPGDKYQADSVARLTIEGIAQCSGTEGILNIFTDALQKCVQSYINCVTEQLNPVLTFEQFRELSKFEDRDCIIALLLISGESRMLQSWSGDQSGKITSLKLSPDILRLEAVKTISDYLDILGKEHLERERRAKALPSSTVNSQKSVKHKWTSELSAMAMHLVVSEKLRATVLQDIGEIELGLDSGSWKAVCVLCGSVCEALLLAELGKDESFQKQQRRLANLIQDAIKTNVIDPRIGKLFDYVRDARNLV